VREGYKLAEKVAGGVFDHGSISLFWTPGQPIPGRGAFGWSYNYQAVGSGDSGAFSFSISRYGLLPKVNKFGFADEF
jgi:hypothetical protein